MATFENEFDYIIVGGGTAGCVLANRLSEDPANKVCLLEAGPVDSNPFISIPAGVAFTVLNPKLSWGLKTVPQKHCNNRELPIPRGRVLGGCSSINGMVYSRGHPGDYSDWVAAGAEGWSYAEVLPYYIKSENNLNFGDSPYHGDKGPMTISSIPKINPIVSSFLEAAEAKGLKLCEDHNEGDPEGFGARQGAIKNGRRVSGPSAFLNSVKSRPNLSVITDAMVHKVLIENRKATGVRFETGGSVREIAARREVILSGGAYGSPALLLHSGIGNAEELKALGIDVVHDLKGVGEGLRDHPSAALQVRTKDTTSYGLSWGKLFSNMLIGLEYIFFRKGPIASNTFEAHGFCKSDPNMARPDLQLIIMPAHRNPFPKALPRGHGYGIVTALVKPNNVGSVKLRSNNPADKPLIDFNFFADQNDMDRLRTGLKLSRSLLLSDIFSKYKGHEILPGPEVETDEQWDEYIRNTCTTVHHACSSCRMGSDDMAVVDTELKVYGIEGLRVVDASVFPTLLAGNSNAPVVMVAEKASDIILGRPLLAPIDLPHVK